MDIHDRINVFIIGLRGYIENYGGWETFAHGLLDNWVDDTVTFYAFEKVSSKIDEGIEIVNKITCIRICEASTRSSAMMKYDKKCLDYAIKYIDKKKLSNAILFFLGLRIGPYCLIKKRKIKSLNIKMLENPAGAEWRRTKWNKMVQFYAYISAQMMAKTVDCMVCDNEGIRELYKKIVYGRKPKLEYVAYGVDSVPRKEGLSKEAAEYLRKWNVEPDQYYLILGRFVPENNYEMMIKGFMKSKTNRKLLIITNYKTELSKFYKHIVQSTNFTSDERIVMAGTLYDQEILHYVRQNAQGYIHGHSVGGTNPGLLEAMSETDINMLYDVDFNHYVGEDAALYFKNEDELTNLIDKVDCMNEKEKIMLGEKARKRMTDSYSWESVVDGYDRIFHEIAEMKD